MFRTGDKRLRLSPVIFIGALVQRSCSTLLTMCRTGLTFRSYRERAVDVGMDLVVCLAGAVFASTFDSFGFRGVTKWP
jgi:hypothetical protein